MVFLNRRRRQRHQETQRLRVLAAPDGAGPADNPYISSLYREVRRHGIDVQPLTRRGLFRAAAPDVIHVHWPELLITWDHGRARAAFDIVKVVGLVALARRRGARLVWTGHNLEPHDVPMRRLYRAYWYLFGHNLDHVVCLSDSGPRVLTERYPWLRGVPTSVVRHGHYRADYPPLTSRELARRELDLPAESAILLILGQIRRYKNVDGFLESFRALAPSDSVLVVAGSATRDPQLEKEIRQLAAGRADVSLRLQFVPDAEVSLLHAAADVVVLPYQSTSALNSGSALLSLSLDTPIIVHGSAPMEDLQADVGDRWVTLFDGSAQQAVSAAQSEAGRSGTPERPDLSAFEWGPIGEATAEVFRTTRRRTRFGR